MVDEDWWMGENAHGQTGLFPSNYVELVQEDDAEEEEAPAAHLAPSASAAGPSVPPSSKSGPTATAIYDYEAAGEINDLQPNNFTEMISWCANVKAEDNEISFPEGATITSLVSH
jgi:drebrin-like protein